VVQPQPRALGALRLKLPGLYLPDSSDFACPSINWRWVESEAELACSQITTIEWLLHQTLASVHHNILCPVQVGLGKKNEKILPVSPTTSSVLTYFFTSCDCTFYSDPRLVGPGWPIV
jgi:hypothetical protein